MLSEHMITVTSTPVSESRTPPRYRISPKTIPDAALVTSAGLPRVPESTNLWVYPQRTVQGDQQCRTAHQTATWFRNNAERLIKTVKFRIPPWTEGPVGCPLLHCPKASPRYLRSHSQVTCLRGALPALVPMVASCG